MLPQQQKKNQESAQAPWKLRSTLGDNKQKLLEHDRHANENTADWRPSLTQKCDAAVTEKVKQRNEEKKTKVLKKEQKSHKRRMRTCKGPKGRRQPGPQQTSQEKKKKAAKDWSTEPNRSGNNQ